MNENRLSGIEQPQYRPLSRDDPMHWASLPRTQTMWFRDVGPRLGIDAPKMILGQVLNKIVEDDANAYTLVHSDFSDSGTITISKKKAAIRLSWEIETLETPPAIRKVLREAQTIITEADWHDPEAFERVKGAQENLVAKVTNMMEEDTTLREAYLYAKDREVQNKWQPFWNEFYGR